MIKGKLKKLCKICGEPVPPFKFYLERHCGRQHQRNNHGFLGTQQLPTKSKYLNIKEFLHDTSIDLKIDPQYRFRSSGRPSKKVKISGGSIWKPEVRKTCLSEKSHDSQGGVSGS